MSLNPHTMICPKGCIHNKYRSFPTEQISNNEYILQLIHEYNRQPNNIIWIRNTSQVRKQTDLDFFANNMNKINKSFILITSDGDRSVPSSYSMSTVNILLESPKVISWFTQNYDRTILHNKLKYIPIGLDLHTQKWYINGSVSKKIKYMIRKRLDIKEKRKDIVLSDFHLNFSHDERRIVYNKIKHNDKFLCVSKQSFQGITDLYNKYQFVLSPRGNGLDCHRSWELFLAGAILITKTSPLDAMYKENNLPVVILQNWNELDDKLDEKLKIWYAKYSPLTSIDNIFPKLTFHYWLH
jgi:hypothetical protein